MKSFLAFLTRSIWMRLLIMTAAGALCYIFMPMDAIPCTFALLLLFFCMDEEGRCACEL